MTDEPGKLLKSARQHRAAAAKARRLASGLSASDSTGLLAYAVEQEGQASELERRAAAVAERTSLPASAASSRVASAKK